MAVSSQTYGLYDTPEDFRERRNTYLLPLSHAYRNIGNTSVGPLELFTRKPDFLKCGILNVERHKNIDHSSEEVAIYKILEQDHR